MPTDTAPRTAPTGRTMCADSHSAAGDGVHCHASDGTLLGKVRIPETVANLYCGGPKRNRLFICARAHAA